MKAVVLAGGMGTRLHPLTVNLPKPMVPLANRPLMEYLIELLSKHGYKEIIALLYHQPEIIKNAFGDGSRFGVKLSYKQADKDFGTAGAVKFALGQIDEPVLVVSADLVTDMDLSAMAELHKKIKAAVTIGLTRTPNPLSYGIVVIDQDQKVQKFLEKPSWGEVFSDTINSGVYILDPKAIALVPEGKPFDFSLDLFPELLKKGQAIYGFVDECYWKDIGQIEDYARAQADALLNRIKINLKPRMGSNVMISPAACIEGLVMIDDGSTIGDGSKIINSIIGKNCIIGRDAIIKESIIWDNAVIGNDVRLFRNTIGKAARLDDRVCVEEGTVVGDNCRVGKDALLKALIKLWPDRVVDEGAIVSQSIIYRKHWTRSIFGSYGVTGVCNIEITPQFAAALGAAYGSILGPNATISSSRDSHKSSRMIYRALIAGVLSAGSNVSNLEMVPIPVSRYAVTSLNFAGGFHVRKSPFDPEVIDIKFFDESGIDLSSSMEKKIERIYFAEDSKRSKIEEVGELTYPLHRVAEKYQEGLLAVIDESQVQSSSLRLVVDYSYGAASQIFPSILGKLGINAVALDAHIDENKITKDLNAFQQSLDQMTCIVKSINADAGVMFDTGAEKIFFSDENGCIIDGNQALFLMALIALKQKPGTTIAVPVKESSYIEKLAKKYGGKVIRTANSFYSMMEPAKKKQAGFVGESLGGFIFSDFMPAFDAMLAAAKLAEFLSREKIKLSEVLREFPVIFRQQLELECSIEQKALIMRRAMELESGSDKKELIDGIKFWHQEAWALVLPDAMRPVLHIYAEAGTQKETQLILERYVNIINKIKQGGAR